MKRLRISIEFIDVIIDEIYLTGHSDTKKASQRQNKWG